jgi:NDP-sugar pyrophosphorylase family protein
MKAGIIAAGDGSRFGARGISTPKPLIQVGGMTLIERTMRSLVEAGIDEIAFIINERMPQVVEAALALDLGVPLHAIVRTTPSSLHSLHALANRLGSDRFVLTTVDTIVRPAEFRGFIHQFAAETSTDVLLSYTDFVDDEKPLRIAVDQQDCVLAIGPEAESSPFVTLGLYGMTPKVFPVIERAVAHKMERLRNFLALLLSESLAVRGCRFTKGVDVDRVEDIQVAESFLQEHQVRM